ncbi:hypothetical protein [Flavobacterium sp.]|uniref:tetratricopeptide repeat protein n=1 Tax=Flavobacterium sp. TaxID=239 RepID=UPI002633ABC7|nr:hypothetical protein [Flavobacterium sp.]
MKESFYQLTSEQKMEDYQIKIKQFEKTALTEFKSGNTENAIVLFENAWDVLPEPKTDKPESYLIANSLVFALNKVKKYAEALEWAKKLMNSALDRHDDGDREYMAGTVLYHLERKEDAWKYFDVANDKSVGRCFIGADKKEYSDFFKNRT